MTLKIRWKHLLWLPINGIIAFLLPFTLLGVIKLSQSAYHIIAFVLCTVLAVYYAKSSSLQLRHSIKPGWALGIIFGVFIGLIFLSFASLSNTGFQTEFVDLGAARIILKSILFGIANALLVTVLPFVIVWRAIGEDLSGMFRKSIVAIVTITAVAAVSFLYSLGLPGSLNGDLQTNFLKTMIAGAPTVISGSPFAAPISNIFLQLSEATAEHRGGSLDRAADLQKHILEA